MADEYLAELVSARDAPAVMKVRFANLRANYSGVVLVFEGVDDKAVYFHWIRQINAELVYEPFLCQGKAQVLQLFDAMERDVTGMGAGVLYFVDRDFDDLQGRAGSASLFMTESYSIENYLVATNVLENLLRVEFHCHGHPDLRRRIVEQFERVYDDFLDVTCPINRRIYVARRFSIRQQRDLPDRLSRIAAVSIDGVAATGDAPDEVVQLVREPSKEELALGEIEFAQVQERRSRYRGKFAILFFRGWLSHLLQDRNSPNPVLFQGDFEDGLVARGPFNCDVLAAKRDAPIELVRFVERHFPRNAEVAPA